MEKIWLLRHGQTRANLEGRFAGRTAEPLTEEGRKQAFEAGKLLAKEDIAALYVSPLRRTLETAAYFLEGYGKRIPIIPEEAFIEINIPPWEGKLKSEIRKDARLKYELWWASPHRFSLPGCETLAQVQERAVKKALALFSSARPPLIITHMVVVRVLLCYFLGLDLSSYRRIPVPNAKPFLILKDGSNFTVEAPEDMLLPDVA